MKNIVLIILLLYFSNCFSQKILSVTGKDTIWIKDIGTGDTTQVNKLVPSGVGKTGYYLTVDSNAKYVWGQLPLEYSATVASVADSSVFWLTKDGTSASAAIYTTINYVSPVVNNVNANYTFGWTISTDKKKLVVRARVATNTAVIALLGLSLLGSTIPVTTGTQIQTIVKGY